jgi:hypothetical protein
MPTRDRAVLLSGQQRGRGDRRRADRAWSASNCRAARFSAGANLVRRLAPGYRPCRYAQRQLSHLDGDGAPPAPTTVRQGRGDYTVLNATLELHHAAWSR